MKRWWLSLAVILGGCIGLASAEYIIVVANVGPLPKAGGPDGKGPFPPGPFPPGPPMGPPPGPNGGPGTGALTMGAPDLKEIEGKIVVTVVPLELHLTGAQQANLLQQATLAAAQGKLLKDQPGKQAEAQQVILTKMIQSKPMQLVYQGKWHAHVISLDLIARNLDKDRVGMQRYLENNRLPLETPARRFAKKHDDIGKGSKPPTEKVRELTELAATAIGYGLNKEVSVVIADIEKIDKENTLVTGYQKLQEALKVPLPDDPLAARRIALTKTRQPASSAHFTLWWSNSIAKGNIEAQSRLERLEDALQTYYLWWLLKGVTVPLPTSKLTVFLDGSEDEFNNLHMDLTFRRELGTAKERAPLKSETHLLSALSTAPVVSGGYYARRLNVTVLSLRRIDCAQWIGGPSYDLLDSYCLNSNIFNKGDRDKVLTTPGKPAESVDAAMSNYEAQSFALMLKLMEEDAERASVSHNVSRQLAVASGLLPQGVIAPEWVEFGIGSFFETPLNAPWASPTDANSLYLPIWKKEFPSATKATGETLKKVIRDGYFRELPTDKAELPAEIRKARATSWALMYFLARIHPAQLKAYFAELARLPRDMEISDEILQRCFCRAFGLWDESSQRVNDAAAKKFELDWFSDMARTSSEFEGLKIAVDRVRNDMAKASAEGNPPPNPGVSGPPR